MEIKLITSIFSFSIMFSCVSGRSLTMGDTLRFEQIQHFVVFYRELDFLACIGEVFRLGEGTRQQVNKSFCKKFTLLCNMPISGSSNSAAN